MAKPESLLGGSILFPQETLKITWQQMWKPKSSIQVVLQPPSLASCDNFLSGVDRTPLDLDTCGQKGQATCLPPTYSQYTSMEQELESHNKHSHEGEKWEAHSRHCFTAVLKFSVHIVV